MNKKFPDFSIITGSVILIAGLFMFAQHYRFVSRATKTIGTVIKLDDSDEVTVPVFVFTNEAGTAYRCRSGVGSIPCFLKPGESVSVVYDAADPTHAEINSIQTLWGLPIFFSGLGGYCIYLTTRKPRLEKRKEMAEPKGNQEWKNYTVKGYPDMPAWVGLFGLGILAVGIGIGYWVGHPALGFLAGFVASVVLGSAVHPLRCNKCNGDVLPREVAEENGFKRFFYDCPACRISWRDQKTRSDSSD